MPDNIYAPPRSGIDAPRQQRRTIAVYSITAMCIVKTAAFAYFMIANRESGDAVPVNGRTIHV